MSSPSYFTFTFSIIAYDPDVQEWGVAVESKSFAVGSAVPWAKAGVGAVVTQAWTRKGYGARALALLKQGRDPKEVIQELIADDRLGAQRQLAVMDAQGRAANYTGEQCPAWAGGIAEPNVSVQGNMLAGERVLKAMLAAFKKTEGKLAERLLAALEAGQRTGGDKRGQQSAALLVVRDKSDIDGAGDVYVDLRVDDHRTPIAELRRLYGIWQRELYAELEGSRINALLRAKNYGRAQQLHRDFVAQAERLARTYPRDANLHNGLAWHLSQNALGLDAALKHARRAVQLKPRSAAIADTLANVWYQRGEPERAAEIERALVKRHPGDAFFEQQLKKFEEAAKRQRRT